MSTLEKDKLDQIRLLVLYSLPNYIMKEVSNVNIKYIGSDTKKSEKGKIHLKNGNSTGCGAKVDDNPQDWVTTSEKVTCDINGCKN